MQIEIFAGEPLRHAVAQPGLLKFQCRRLNRPRHPWAQIGERFINRLDDFLRVLNSWSSDRQTFRVE